MICTSGLSRSSSIRRIALRHFFQAAVSETISLGLLAMPLVLVNQHLSRDDARLRQPPRDDCSRERLAPENRLFALCTDPILTHLLLSEISLSYVPPTGRNVACQGDSEGGNGQRGSDAGGRSGCIRRRQRPDPGLEVEAAGGERPPDRWRRRAQAVLRDVPDWFW